MTPQEVLLRAAELIERPGGWARGMYCRWDSFANTYAYCATGAVLKAGGYVFGAEERRGIQVQDWDRTASGQALNLLRQRVDSGGITRWNDYVADTADQVARVMREAAELLDSAQALREGAVTLGGPSGTDA